MQGRPSYCSPWPEGRCSGSTRHRRFAGVGLSASVAWFARTVVVRVHLHGMASWLLCRRGRQSVGHLYMCIAWFGLPPTPPARRSPPLRPPPSRSSVGSAGSARGFAVGLCSAVSSSTSVAYLRLSVRAAFAPVLADSPLRQVWVQRQRQPPPLPREDRWPATRLRCPRWQRHRTGLNLPGGTVVPAVPAAIVTDRGERARFLSDVLYFSQQVNQSPGKIQSGPFNAMFDYRGCWHQDEASTRTLCFDGRSFELYAIDRGPRAGLALVPSQPHKRVESEPPPELGWDGWEVELGADQSDAKNMQQSALKREFVLGSWP